MCVIYSLNYRTWIVLNDEWQFEDRSPSQMVVHVNHLQEGQQSHLLAKYFSWRDYSLSDRRGLQDLLDEIEVRKIDLGPVAEAVEEASQMRKAFLWWSQGMLLIIWAQQE
jgi:hypothetical protein